MVWPLAAPQLSRDRGLIRGHTLCGVRHESAALAHYAISTSRSVSDLSDAMSRAILLKRESLVSSAVLQLAHDVLQISDDDLIVGLGQRVLVNRASHNCRFGWYCLFESAGPIARHGRSGESDPQVGRSRAAVMTGRASGFEESSAARDNPSNESG
jgi:hypothetical protein